MSSRVPIAVEQNLLLAAEAAQAAQAALGMEESTPSLPKLRAEFSLILQTLRVLQKMEMGSDEPDAVISVFDSLRCLLDSCPPLSLSSYWEKTGQDFSLVSKHGGNSDRILDDEHDPMNIVQFLVDKARTTIALGNMRGQYVHV